MLKMNNNNKNIRRKKPLKEYYSNYYNQNFMRDFRYIPDDKTKYNRVFNAKKLGRKWRADSRALHFLTKADHQGDDGLLGGEITYYKSREEFQSGMMMDRWSDRLFFDLDIEDLRVDMIKDEMKRAYQLLSGNELSQRLDELKADFQDLIFNSDLIYPTFHEAKKLCLYLEELGLIPYLIFSGAKGFHINIFFDEVRLQNLSQVSRLFGKTFADKLNLKYLDYAVFDRKKAQRRLQRCQYAFNSKTNLITIPIPQVYNYDEVLKIIRDDNPRPIPFNMEEYSSKSGEFRESLIYNDKQFQKINARRERELRKENEEKRRLMKNRGLRREPEALRKLSRRSMFRSTGHSRCQLTAGFIL